MTDGSSRKRRIGSVSQPDEHKPSQTQPGEKKDQLGMKKAIDQMRAELAEERCSAYLESDYWDETHDWGSLISEASSEYWHFLGRYE